MITYWIISYSALSIVFYGFAFFKSLHSFLPDKTHVLPIPVEPSLPDWSPETTKNHHINARYLFSFNSSAMQYLIVNK